MPDPEEGFPHWAVLADSGYEGAQELVRAITPIKKGQGLALSASEELHNSHVATNRVVCENFYGRMVSLFRVISGTYRHSHARINTIFRICVALTNFHVAQHPLRDEETRTLHGWIQVMNEARVKAIETRARKQTASRYKKRALTEEEARLLADVQQYPPSPA